MPSSSRPATDGRLIRFEAVAAAGLMTLHPNQAGSILHGNVVEDAGIDHLTLEWSHDHALLSFGEPILAAACLGRLRSELLPRQPSAASRSVRRSGVPRPLPGDSSSPGRLRMPGGWSIRRIGLERVFELDRAGILVLPGEVRWPLER